MTTRLQRIRRIAILLDSQYAIFGYRFGWDFLVGLIPGYGDLLGALFSLYIVFEGFVLGCPWLVIFRMLLNIAIETIIGAIPIFGDFFDIMWKSNLKNLDLIERHYAQSKQKNDI